MKILKLTRIILSVLTLYSLVTVGYGQIISVNLADVDGNVIGLNPEGSDTPGTENPLAPSETFPPSIEEISSTFASEGDVLTISGKNLSTVTEVGIGGLSINFTVVGDALEVTVPEGADTGMVTVTNPDGTDDSAGLVVVLDTDSVVFSEDFSTGFGVFEAFSIASNANWEPSSFEDSNSMEINGFGADEASDDWLVTPAINLTNVTSAFMIMGHERAFSGPPLEVKISTDWDGTGTPATASWTDLSVDLAGDSTNKVIDSGPVDLSAYDGDTIHVAIRYATTGTGTGDGAVDRIHYFAVQDGGQKVTFSDTTFGAVNDWMSAYISYGNGMWLEYVETGLSSVEVQENVTLFQPQNDGESDKLEHYLFQEFGAGLTGSGTDNEVFETGDAIIFKGTAASTRSDQDVVIRAFVRMLGYNELGWAFQVKPDKTSYASITEALTPFEISITFPDIEVDDSYQVLQLGFEIITEYDAEAGAMDSGTISFKDLEAFILRDSCNVTFDLGIYGLRQGGGELNQLVNPGSVPEEPIVEPLEGWVFVGWNTPIAETYENTNYTAVYEPLYHAVVLQNQLGTIGLDLIQEEYAYGTSLTLTATPPEGYRFASWTGDAIGTENPLIIVIDGDKTIGADFVRQWTLNLDVALEGGGTVSGAGLYDDGTSAEVTAIPANGYRFDRWEGTGIQDPTSSTTQILLDQDRSAEAVFVQTFEVSVVAEPSEAGSVTGGGTFDINSEVTITASPTGGTEFRFLYWELGSSRISDNPYSFTVAEDIFVTAVMGKTSYTVNVSALNGTVEITPEAASYPYQTEITLTATPNAGYQFAGWTGLTGATSPVHTFSLESDIDATAQFRPKPFVSRFLPDGYVPTSAFVVQLEVTPDSHISSYAIEESYPAGWTVTETTGSGIDDPQTNTVRFGPYFDNQSKTLTYVIEPPERISEEVNFYGRGSADGIDSDITGDIALGPILVHPADVDPVDWNVSVNEITAYGAAWKRGNDWGILPSPIPVNYVTRAGAIWKGGEIYCIDESELSPPNWWVLCVAETSQDGIYRLLETTIPDPTRAVRTVYPGRVELSVKPGSEVAVYAVEEVIPAGLIPDFISLDGQFDDTQGKVKWGPYFDNQPRTLHYQVDIGDTPAQFDGVVSLDGVGQSFEGDLSFVPGSTGWQTGDGQPVGTGEWGVSVFGKVYAEMEGFAYFTDSSIWLYRYGSSAFGYYLYDPETRMWFWTADYLDGWVYQFGGNPGWVAF